MPTLPVLSGREVVRVLVSTEIFHWAGNYMILCKIF